MGVSKYSTVVTSSLVRIARFLDLKIRSSQEVGSKRRRVAPKSRMSMFEILEPRLYLSASVTPTAYFVSTTGLSTNTGTLSSPWNLTTATQNAQPGDTVYVEGGTYMQEMVIDNSGTAANPITYQAYPGESPTIDLNYQGPTGGVGGVVTINASYIVLNGFNIEDGATPIVGAGSGSGIAMKDSINGPCNNDVIENNVIHNIQGRGMGIQGNNNLIQGNTVYDTNLANTNGILGNLHAPVWVQLTRSGNTFTAYYSTDGSTWTQLGLSQTINMNSALLSGLAVTSNNASASSTAVFGNVTTTPLDSSAWSDQNIGSPSASGSASYNGTTWTVSSSGSDIVYGSDQFNFASQNFSGNGSISAHVTSQTDTSSWAKSGVMFRNDNTPGSAFAAVLVTPSNGVLFEWRSTALSAAAQVSAGGYGDWGSGITVMGIAYNGNSTVWTGNTIANNTVYDNWGEGIYGYYGVNDTTIEGNTVYNNFALNIALDQSTNGVLRDNLSYFSQAPSTMSNWGLIDITQEKPPSGTVSTQSDNNTIYNNFTYGNPSTNVAALGVTYFTSSGSYLISNTSIYDNTVINPSGYAYGSGGSLPGLQLRDNIFDGSINPQYPLDNGYTPVASNNYWLTTPTGWDTAVSSPSDVIGNAQNYLAQTGSTNPGAMTDQWFKLLSNSPAIGHGTPLSSVPTDAFGNPRDPVAPDIGADEFIPAAPANLAAAVISSSQITLTWSASAGPVTGYNIFRGTTPGGEGATPINSSLVTTTSYTDSGLNAGAPYYYTVEAVNSAGSSPASSEASGVTSLPIGWSDQDIGNPGVAGSAQFNFNNAAWTVSGSGADIFYSSDQFNFASQNFSGNGSVVAQVDSQTNTNSWAKAGVMFRNDNTAGSAFADVVVTPGNGVAFEWRSTALGAASDVHILGIAAPAWVELTRAGNTFTAYYSTNGSTWTQIGTTQTISMNSTVLGGLAVTSLSNTVASTAVFSNVGLIPPGSPPWSDQNIGDPGVSGSVYFNGTNWTVSGSGADIFWSSDQFNFYSQNYTGDGSIVAQIDSQTNTNSWAKSGVMFRNDNTTTSAFADVVVTPGNGVVFTWRSTASTAANDVQITGITAPVWVGLSRAGNVFTAYYSADGSTWVQIGAAQTISMNSTALAGLAVTSLSNTVASTAVFSNVSMMPASALAPASPLWSDQNIGSPAIAGSTEYNGTTWTVSGSGSDIWNSSDQFNFASQSFTGDGSIVAQVDSQTNTDPWAKAGVMFRNDNTAGSAFADVVATPGNGVAFQWRGTASGTTNEVDIAGITGLVWTKLTRAGNVFTAFYSTDGSTWLQIGPSQTISMNTTILAGLAVTSHNVGLANTAVFSNVLLV